MFSSSALILCLCLPVLMINSVAGLTRVKRLIGGSQAKPHSFPSLVSLKDNERHRCGGVIVSAEWVLTTVNCAQAQLSVVVAGEHHLAKKDGSEQESKVKSVHSHPDYKKQNDENDIALLRLATPFKLNQNVSAANLPAANSNPSGEVKTAGWGSLDTKSVNPSDTLQELILSVLPIDQCQAKYKEFSIVNQNFCTFQSGGSKGTCNGDTGGPIYSLSNPPTVVGLISYGVECTVDPDVHVKVSSYLDWINKTIKS